MFNQSSSVWELTAEPAPATQPISGDVDCDVAVVGGGFTGLNAALELAENRRSVIVLEQGEIGGGASGQNGGQVVPGLKHDPDTLLHIGGERLLDFAGDSAGQLFDFIRRHNLQCHASQSGWLQPAVTEAQLQVVSGRAEQWRRSRSVDTHILDREAVRAATGTTAYLGGWIDPRGGSLQPLSYVRELARVAMAAGARVHTSSKVGALAEASDGWALTVGSHRVRAANVVIATNGYTGGLVPGLAKSIFPSHSVQIATEPLPQEVRSRILPARLPVSDARRLLKYYRLDPEGRFLIGGRGSFGAKESGRYYGGLKHIAQEMFPDLKSVQWAHQWAGKIALTLDHLPHIHNPQRGLYAALGYNGRGVAIASRMGVLVAQIILGMPVAESPIPTTQVRAVPFHAFRRPAMEATVAWYRLLDRLGY
jgi:sarcosine oxidase